MLRVRQTRYPDILHGHAARERAYREAHPPTQNQPAGHNEQALKGGRAREDAVVHDQDGELGGRRDGEVDDAAGEGDLGVGYICVGVDVGWICVLGYGAAIGGD